MRLYHWGRAFDGDMLVTVSHYERHPDGSSRAVVNDTHRAYQAQMYWIETLRAWNPKVLSLYARSGPDLRDDIFASFKISVMDPYWFMEAEVEADNDSWSKNTARRTDWDNYLWDQWFGEFQYEPADVAPRGYIVMLTREWWREVAPTMSKRQLREMLDWYVQDVPRGEFPEQFTEDLIMPLEQALMFDQMPPFFDEVAAPPVGKSPFPKEGSA